MNVKTYLLDCDGLTGAAYEKYYDTVSDERRAKIDKIKSASNKRLSLGAGILVKKVLGKQKILTTEYGKPYIDDSDICFNLSHSGSFALLTVADSEIGCDIQKITQSDGAKIAARFFTENEQKLIAKNGDMFFRMWSVKESYMKVLGKGLAVPLDSFEVQFKNGAPYINNGYTVKEFSLDGYAIAVCIKGNAKFDNIEKCCLD